VIRSRRLPTISRPYARSMGESEYPELWRGLVGAWPFGMQGGGNVAYDFSNQEADGTLENSVTWSTGQYRSAINSVNGDSHVLINRKIISGELNSSIFAWIKIESSIGRASGGRALYSERTEETSIWKLNLLDTNPASDLIFTHRDSSNNLTQIPTSVDTNDGNWHHVGLVKRGTSVSIYFDGAVASSGSLNGGDTLTVNQTSIGTDLVSTVHGMVGLIDQVYVFNVALLSHQVESLHEIPYAPFIKRRRIWGFQSVAAESTFPPNSLALTGVGR